MKGKRDSKKRLASRNLSMAAMWLEGKAQREIAKVVNMSQQQVSNVLSSQELKPYIDKAIEHNVLGLEEAYKAHDELIRCEDRKIRLSAVELRYKIGGITPTHTQHPVIQAVFNIGQAIILSPVVHELMDKHLDHVIDGEIIEGDEE